MSYSVDERLRMRLGTTGEPHPLRRFPTWLELSQMTRPQVVTVLCEIDDPVIQQAIRNNEPAECLGLFDGHGIFWEVGVKKMPVRIKRIPFDEVSIEVMCGIPWADWVGDVQEGWLCRGERPDQCRERRLAARSV